MAGTIINDGSTKLHEVKAVYTQPIQSADTLFNFMKKPEFLYMIFKNMAIVPRYYKEEIDYLNIGMKEIAYPMVCFCDINLHRIDAHMEFYGGYGIAFSKQWGIKSGIQSIQYINKESGLRKDFTEAFNVAINEDEKSEKLANYILTHMCFFKPIEGDMEVCGAMKHKNFTDECEWRYVPNMSSTDMPLAVPEHSLFQITTLNKAMLKVKEVWLTFTPEDIKYIIIQSPDEMDELITIFRDKGLSEKQIFMLVSKIIIWPEAKGDF